MNRLPNYIKPIREFLLQNGVPNELDATVILGSGLGGFSESVNDSIQIPYGDIPGFPKTTVQGHSGKLVSGTLSGRQILAFSGRFHHYEGHPYHQTLLPVHLSAAFNTKKLIISNAAGAINTTFRVGDLMVIDDLIRPFHPLTETPGNPFKYNLYQSAEKARTIASEIGLKIQKGSYIYVKGPNYETKAEIRAFRILGADVVGMSTAPELIEAARLDMRAVAVSLVTNMAAGVEKGTLDHSEVEEAAELRKEDFTRLVRQLILKL